MGIFKRAFAHRPDDSGKSFFFVKVKKDEQIKGKGIACAVEKEVRGQKKFFLLTGTDVKTDQGKVFAEGYHRPWWRPKRKKVEIGKCYEDSNFSFIPLDCKPGNSLKLVAEEKKDIKKCHSFVITEATFKTVNWTYDNVKKRYRLSENNGIELQEPSAAGSPVLWTDNANGSCVVGVIKLSSDGKFLPEMFTACSLELPAAADHVELTHTCSRPSAFPAQPGPNLKDPAQAGPNSKEPTQRAPTPQEPAQTGHNPQKPAQETLTPQEPVQTGNNIQQPDQETLTPQEPAQTGNNLQQPDQEAPNPREPAQKILNPQEPAQTGNNPQKPAQEAPNPQEHAQTGHNPQKPDREAPNPQEPAPKVLNPQEPAQKAPTPQESAQTGHNPQEPAQTGINTEEPTQTGHDPQKPAQTGPNAKSPAQRGPNPQEPVHKYKVPNTQEPALTGQNPQEPKEMGGNSEEPTYGIVNVTVKVPKSVVAFAFLIILILGIFAMEWWFPWLTGRAIKMCYPPRNP